MIRNDEGVGVTYFKIEESESFVSKARSWSRFFLNCWSWSRGKKSSTLQPWLLFRILLQFRNYFEIVVVTSTGRGWLLMKYCKKYRSYLWYTSCKPRLQTSNSWSAVCCKSSVTEQPCNVFTTSHWHLAKNSDYTCNALNQLYHHVMVCPIWESPCSLADVDSSILH